MKLAQREEKARSDMVAKRLFIVDNISAEEAFETYANMTEKSAKTAKKDKYGKETLKRIQIYIATVLVPDLGSLSNRAKKAKAAELKSMVEKSVGREIGADEDIKALFIKGLLRKVGRR